MNEQRILDGLANAPDAFDYIYECISGSHGEELRAYAADLYHDVAMDFDYIYECISGSHGEELRAYAAGLYHDVAIDTGLHPDDDFEGIINIILDDLGA